MQSAAAPLVEDISTPRVSRCHGLPGAASPRDGIGFVPTWLEVFSVALPST